MTFLILFSILDTLGLIALATMFYYQQQRQEKLAEREAVLTGWCETLMENEETLAKDTRNLRHEIQTVKDERKR